MSDSPQRLTLMIFDTDKTINDVQITSVILHRDKTDKEHTKLYLFHCIRCGNPVVQYQGFIVNILPGMAPIELPIVVRCNNSSCKHKYAMSAVV